MSSKKGPSLEEHLPKVPSYHEDPAYARSVGRLESLGTRLTGFDFAGELSPLSETITLDPNVTAGFFKSLEPYYNQMRRQTISDLAASNQLESSVTANRLGQIDTDVSSLLQGRVADQLTQAMQNRINLFGTGINTLSGVAAYGQANQGQRNAFNLDTYQLMVDRAMANFAQQKGARGGFGGALTGAAGGAATGAAIGSIIPGVGTAIGAGVGAIAGGLYGGLSRQPGAGGELMTSGASLLGSRLTAQTPTGIAPYSPGSYATNRPFASDYQLRGYADRLYGGLN